MRLLLIRHAQSLQNLYMETVLDDIASGAAEPHEFMKKMRDAPPGAHGGADSPLSLHGTAQTLKLGATYSPLLVDAARRGQLHVFVSPFQRTMRTADPLMRALASQVPGLKAAVLPMIMEDGGLCSPADMQRLDEIERMVRQGKRKEAIAHLKTIQWEPQGMSGAELLAEFPWCTLLGSGGGGRGSSHDDYDEMMAPLFAATTGGEQAFGGVLLVADSEDPWWRGGFEGQKSSEARSARLARWLGTSLPAKVPEDAVVVLVSHGGTIARLTNKLMGWAVSGGETSNDQRASSSSSSSSSMSDFPQRAGLSLKTVFNTAVSSFHVPGPGADFRLLGGLPSASGEADSFRIRVDYFNDTAHLGDEAIKAAAARL